MPGIMTSSKMSVGCCSFAASKASSPSIAKRNRIASRRRISPTSCQVLWLIIYNQDFSFFRCLGAEFHPMSAVTIP